MKKCVVCHADVNEAEEFCPMCGAHANAVLVKDQRAEGAVQATYRAGEETWKIQGVIEDGVWIGQKRKIS